jgi:hypothetical protein
MLSTTSELAEVALHDGEVDASCEAASKMPSAGPPPRRLLCRSAECELQEAFTIAAV